MTVLMKVLFHFHAEEHCVWSISLFRDTVSFKDTVSHDHCFRGC